MVRNDSKNIYKVILFFFSRLNHLVDECIPCNLVTKIAVARKTRCLNWIDLVAFLVELICDGHFLDV